MIDILREVTLFTKNRSYVGIHTEFENVNPKDDKQLERWYKMSRQYILANSRHGRLKEVDLINILPDECRVLDFGGGAGSDSIYLADNGYRVDYIDICREQQKFIKWIKKKYGLADLRVLNNPRGKYDCVIMRDVIEHLHDYRPIIKKCIAHLMRGGLLINIPHFLSNDRVQDGSVSIHYHDKYDLPNYLKSLGMERMEEFLWQKMV